MEEAIEVLRIIMYFQHVSQPSPTTQPKKKHFHLKYKNNNFCPANSFHRSRFNAADVHQYPLHHHLVKFIEL